MMTSYFSMKARWDTKRQNLPMKLEIIGIAIDSHSLVFEKKSKSLLRPREKKKRRRRC